MACNSGRCIRALAGRRNNDVEWRYPDGLARFFDNVISGTHAGAGVQEPGVAPNTTVGTSADTSVVACCSPTARSPRSRAVAASTPSDKLAFFSDWGPTSVGTCCCCQWRVPARRACRPSNLRRSPVLRPPTASLSCVSAAVGAHSGARPVHSEHFLRMRHVLHRPFGDQVGRSRRSLRPPAHHRRRTFARHAQLDTQPPPTASCCHQLPHAPPAAAWPAPRWVARPPSCGRPSLRPHTGKSSERHAAHAKHCAPRPRCSPCVACLPPTPATLDAALSQGGAAGRRRQDALACGQSVHIGAPQRRALPCPAAPLPHAGASGRASL